MKFCRSAVSDGVAWILVVSAFAAFAQAGSDAEAPSLTLTPAGITKLRQLIDNDAEAHARFAEIIKAADSALADKPNPVDVIVSQGKLASDPNRIKTHKALADMHKMQALAYAYVVSDDSKYAEASRRFVVAWAQRCKPQGDPIDDTNLESLIVAYDLTKATYSIVERSIVDMYLRQVFSNEARTGGTGNRKGGLNNWNSHRLKVEGLIAFTSHDTNLISKIKDAFEKQVANNLRPDGSSVDFETRDALHYHAYDIEPLLVLATAARNNRLNFYAYESPGGSSLRKAVAWFIPFETGNKTHAEFVNSKVAFDQKRAKAGEKEYVAGHPWNPDEGLDAIEHAELWDPTLLALTTKLAHSKDQEFPTWQTVLNDACR